MNVVRIALLVLMVLMSGVHHTAAQEQEDDAEFALDLAAIPLTPPELIEPGYLLEGGGYLHDAATVENLIASLDGGDPGGFGDDGWRQSYMHRLVLLADMQDPASDLLADGITLVHEFESEDSASGAYEDLIERYTELGEATEADTFRVVNESADSLVSVFVSGPLLVQVVSTDLTGPPDADVHRATVDTTRLRAEAEASDPVPGLSAFAVRIDDMKLITFADTPDSYQHYLTDAGVWIPTVAFPEANRDTSGFGIVGVFESQQQVVLNTGDQAVFQGWLAEFESEDAAQAFAADPPLGELPTPMFADQADAVGSHSGYEIHGVLEDGSSYSGFRDISVSGTRVAVTGLLGSGNLLINREQAAALAQLQIACLEESLCEPVLAAEILAIEGMSTPSPVPEDEGVFTSTNFGWSIDYAAAGWELNSVEGIEGVDFLDLGNGDSLATIETVVDRNGDPPTCVVDELRLLEEFEDHAVITLGSDVEGEQTAGNEPGHAWAVYTVEPLADERADQEYTIRIDCYTLIAGEASLVVTHIAPRDLWATESAKGEDLRANIEIREAAAAASDGLDGQVRNADVMLPRIWIPRIETPRAA
jgi:hypothetical protein